MNYLVGLLVLLFSLNGYAKVFNDQAEADDYYERFNGIAALPLHPNIDVLASNTSKMPTVYREICMDWQCHIIAVANYHSNRTFEEYNRIIIFTTALYATDTLAVPFIKSVAEFTKSYHYVAVRRISGNHYDKLLERFNIKRSSLDIDDLNESFNFAAQDYRHGIVGCAGSVFACMLTASAGIVKRDPWSIMAGLVSCSNATWGCVTLETKKDKMEKLRKKLHDARREAGLDPWTGKPVAGGGGSGGGSNGGTPNPPEVPTPEIPIPEFPNPPPGTIIDCPHGVCPDRP